jgi:hypothetical protein
LSVVPLATAPDGATARVAVAPVAAQE